MVNGTSWRCVGEDLDERLETGSWIADDEVVYTLRCVTGACMDVLFGNSVERPRAGRFSRRPTEV